MISELEKVLNLQITSALVGRQCCFTHTMFVVGGDN